MALQPLFNRIVLKPVAKKEAKSTSGLLVTGSQYDKTEELHGQVVAIGRDVEIVKVGDIVSFPAYGYDSVSENDGTMTHFMSIREPEVLAIVAGAPLEVPKTPEELAKEETTREENRIAMEEFDARN